MWWFPSCFRHDPSKDDIKTAEKISRYEKEDRIVRQQRQVLEDEKNELEKAKEESLKQAKQDEKRRSLEDSKEKGKKVDDGQEDDDEQLAKSNMENFKDKGKLIKHSKNDVKEDVNPPPDPPSISYGGKSEINGDGISVNPQCLCCHLCDKPIAMDELPKKGKYHKQCYKANHKCYVCKKKMPSTEKGIEYSAHPFWKEKYCPGHDNDGTAKCCSCERLEPRGTNFVMLGDDRWLCLQCMESSVMDTYEGHSLHVEIRDFFEGLFFKIDKEFPLLLVEKQALNKAEEEEKIDYHGGVVTRGLCMYEEQIVRNIIKGPTLGPDKQLVDMVTETQRVGGCEVTGILIIYGLPRLLTGFLLAHEMMHAWLRLNGYRNLKLELEEGLCQALGLRWLESQTFVSTDAAAAVASSSSRTPPAAITSKKSDEWSDFEKKYVEFCIYQIKEDETPVYGQGFKQVYQMLVSNDFNIKDTLKDIVTASKTNISSNSKF